MNTYNIGNLVRLSSAFTTQAGAPVDPTTITVRIKDPTGHITVLTYPANISKDDTGAFHADFVPTMSGYHSYRWEGTGAATAAAETQFSVNPSAIV